MKVHSLYSDAHSRDISVVPEYPDALRELVRNGEDAQYYVAPSYQIGIAVMALYRREEREPCIEALAVDRSLRDQNRRLGSRALYELEQFALQDGLWRITLTTTPTVAPFYEKNGYHSVLKSKSHVDMIKNLRK